MDEISLLETEWQDKIVSPAEPLGLQELNDNGVVLRVMIKTVPLVQWETQRRLNRRVKMRFDQEGVEFASPRRNIYIDSSAQLDSAPSLVAASGFERADATQGSGSGND
jgi:small conductance mechanosensitive channel